MFVWLAALPLTANGKLDRRALPVPVERPELDVAFEAPRSVTERVLAGLWVELLGVDRVGVHDNFFELGGHSLLATQLLWRLQQQHGIDLPVRVVFEAPTVARLASALDAAETGTATAITAVARDGELPLSYAQQRLWFLHQLMPSGSAYHMQWTARLRGRLDLAALDRAVTALVARHEVLRTRFTVLAGRPNQVIDAPRPVTVPVTDLTGVRPEQARRDAARAVRVEESATPFDLATGPVHRARLVRLGPEEHLLVWTMHHIAGDGRSMNRLSTEIAALYRAELTGAPSGLPELPVQYVDFAAWQRDRLQGPAGEAALSYWREQLAGAEQLELPTDRPRGALRTGGAVHSFELDAELVGRLRELGGRHGATLFMTLLAGFATLLHRYTGQRDFTIGCPVSDRHQAETANLIGLFLNVLVMRVDCSGDPSFAELLERVRDTAIEAYTHQELPFEVLVDELSPERDLARNPLYQVDFQLHPRFTTSELLDLPGLEMTDEPEIPTDSAVVDLSLYLAEWDGRVRGDLRYRTDLFDVGSVERLVGSFVVLLGSVVGGSGLGLSGLGLLSSVERGRLLGWGWGGVGVFGGGLVHELFEGVVGRCPGATAVVCEGVSLSFAELDRRAGLVAGRLRGLGVGPEVLVGLCVGRGSDRSRCGPSRQRCRLGNRRLPARSPRHRAVPYTELTLPPKPRDGWDGSGGAGATVSRSVGGAGLVTAGASRTASVPTNASATIALAPVNNPRLRRSRLERVSAPPRRSAGCAWSPIRARLSRSRSSFTSRPPLSPAVRRARAQVCAGAPGPAQSGS
ncbi:condensation domain-containing protein [Plantactinospora sp. BB1]|uniref:condensation domain-containing protein n=1 Tax=Plantactinospora sp. BB1 TaxID=2071627 RepID=UPI00131EF5C7|nr:condensation domain-containing protein [Plantactinospora sp. BB1]